MAVLKAAKKSEKQPKKTSAKKSIGKKAEAKSIPMGYAFSRIASSYSSNKEHLGRRAPVRTGAAARGAPRGGGD